MDLWDPIQERKRNEKTYEDSETSLETKKLRVQEDTPALLPERNTTIVQTILESYTETVKSNVEEQINQILTEIKSREERTNYLELQHSHPGR